MCDCIKTTTEVITKSMHDKCVEKNETMLEIKNWDGEGLQGTTFAFGNNGLSGEFLKTDFIFKSTFKKKNGTDSKPKNNHVSIIYTYCPFCGVKYRKDSEEPDAEECDATEAK